VFEAEDLRMEERRSLAALAAEWTGMLAVLAALAGAVAGSQEWLPGALAFRIFGLGLVAGVLTLVVAVFGLLRTRAASGRSGRGHAVVGAILGGGLTVLLFVLAAPGRNLPTINDITTDLEDPPAFEAIARLPANRSADLDYPGEVFAVQQRRGYPALDSLRVPTPPAETFEAAVDAAEDLGWTLVATDPEAMRIEASEETDFFHFVDDVVVRVRPDPSGEGSEVDVRSRSRVGRGDLGANAARIRDFFAALQERS
jgi:uncharacterized protein (DUF1499 family)